MRGNTFIACNKAPGSKIANWGVVLAKLSKSGYLVWHKTTGRQGDMATDLLAIGKQLYITGRRKINGRSSIGFVRGYNAHLGTELFQSHVFWAIDRVTASSRTIWIGGHSDSSVIGRKYIYLQELDPNKGRLLNRLRIPTRGIVSDLLIIDGALYILTENERRLQLFIGTVTKNSISYKERSIRIEGQNARLARAKNGDLVISHTSTSGFALSIIRGNGGDLEASQSYGGKDVPAGVGVNRFDFSFILGSSTKGEMKHGVPVLWVYDVRKGKHVTNYMGATSDCNEITKFMLDENMDVTFTGVRMKGGKKQVMVGTFGVPRLLKQDLRAVGTPGPAKVSNGEQQSNVTADKPSGDKRKEHKGVGVNKKSFWVKQNGKPSTAAIVIICIAIVMLILLGALFWSYQVRRKREALVIEKIQEDARESNVHEEKYRPPAAGGGIVSPYGEYVQS